MASFFYIWSQEQLAITVRAKGQAQFEGRISWNPKITIFISFLALQILVKSVAEKA